MGILDFLGGNTDSSQTPAMDPRMMGLLGAMSAFGAANPPQAASRLPLAHPSMAYQLSQAAGGYGQGYGAGIQQRNEAAKLPYMQAQTAGANLGTLNALQSYNLWAPFMGQSPLSMGDLQSGKFDQKTMAQAVNGPPPQSATQGGQPPAPQGQPPQVGLLQPPTPSAPPAPSGGLLGNISGATPPVQPPNQGGVPAMGAGGGLDLSQVYNLPPILQQKMGLAPSPEMNALWQAGYRPGMPEYDNAMKSVAINKIGIKPVVPGERPGQPDKVYNMRTGNYDIPAGQLGPNGQLAQQAFSSAYGQGQGGLPSKEAEASFKAGLDVRTNNEIDKRRAYYQTGVMPQDYGSEASAPVTSPSGDIATPRGTVVPPPPKMTAYPGTDAIVKQNTNTAELEKGYNSIRGNLDATESRLVALGNALKTVQSDGLVEHRAELANTLGGIFGQDNPAVKSIMSGSDVAAVQTALGLQTLDVLGQLRAATQGSGRILNSEFVNLLDKQYGPNMKPQANYDLITQALGGIYQTRNMISDYNQYAKPAGWRDAGAFQDAYWSRPENSYENMVKQSQKTIGPLKGMYGATPSFPAPPPQAVNHLKMAPDTKAQFDQLFGPGAAAKALGGQ